MSRTKVKTDVLFGVLTFLLPFLLYMSTLCPTVPVGDGGELICAAYSLGIAHPTGYPLFCLWGRIFILLLPVANIAVRINLMSAFFASLAALFVFFLARELFSNIFPQGRPLLPAMALLTAAIFSFSETMWSQAVQSEVYTLHIALVALLMLIMVIWRRTADGRLAYLWAFLWGLSLGNHTSVIILLAPALYLALSHRRRMNLKRFLPGMALFFTLGISLYLYLPLRSAANPPHDWGNPETLDRLWNHATARQYRRFFLFAFPLDVWNNLGHYVKLLIHQFGVFLVSLSLVGAVLQGARRRGLFMLFLLVGLLNVLLAASYDIQDIEAYYLPSYLIFSLWLGLSLSRGLCWLRSHHRGRAVGIVAAAGLVVLAAIPLMANFPRASQRGRTIAREYGLNILSSVKPGAILLTASDNESFPVLYLHDVEGVRSDISVFDLGSTVERMRRFLGLKMVAGQQNPGRLRRMVVEKTRRPVYFTKEHMSAGTDVLQMDDLSLEPFGLVYRLRRDADQTLEAPLPWANYSSSGMESAGQLSDYRVRMMVANYHLSWGEDLWVRGDSSTALEQFALAQKALEDVEKAKIHNEMGVFFRRIGWTRGARQQFERALICPQKTRMDESHIHVNLGNLFVDLGRKILAQKEMALALTIWPGNRTAQFNLARLRANEHLEGGRFGAAARELEKMLALDPDNATICYNLGLIYGRRLAEHAKAREHFRHCLILDPKGPVGAAAKAEMVRLDRQMRSSKQ